MDFIYISWCSLVFKVCCKCVRCHSALPYIEHVGGLQVGISVLEVTRNDLCQIPYLKALPVGQSRNEAGVVR